MNYTQLDEELRSMAADPPDSAVVRAAVIHGVGVRDRRRRATALVSSVLAVVVTIGGIGLASRIGHAAPTPAAPTWPVEHPVSIPDGSTMVPFSGALTVTSPVTPTVDPPADADTVVWSRDVDTLQVAWTNPNAAGVAAAAPRSNSAVAPADLVQRGYVVSPAAALTVWGMAADGTEQDRLAPLVAPEQIQLAGHPATLGGDPGSAWAQVMGVGPAARWLAWRLPDGRYVHAWVGAGGDAALLAFGAGLVNRPTTLTRKVTVGATLPGYTVEGISEIGTTTELDGASSVLCPTGTTSTQGMVTRPCLVVMVTPTRTLRLDPTAPTSSVTVDGLITRIDRATSESTAELGRGFSVTVLSALTTNPPDLDIATLAASVRLDPSVSVGHSPLIDPPPGPATYASSPVTTRLVTDSSGMDTTSRSTAAPTRSSGR